MRCVPGDIVQFIGCYDPMLSPLENRMADTMRGHITQVTSFDPVAENWRLSPPLRGVLIEGMLKVEAMIVAAADECLRPIRPTDGVDEMLAITGKPDVIRETLHEIRRELDEEHAS